VKNGDGSADVKPIAHLYKTQVYALARHMGLPDEICGATPTTDTYSLPQGRTSSISRCRMPDGHRVVGAEPRPGCGRARQRARITEVQAQHVYNDIEAKRRTSATCTRGRAGGASRRTVSLIRAGAGQRAGANR